MKKALLFIVVLLVAAGGGAYWFLTSGVINDEVKKQIEVQGSALTRQNVGVGLVDINLLEGAGRRCRPVLHRRPGSARRAG